MNSVHLVTEDTIEDIWPIARDLVQKALVHSEGAMQTSDVLRCLLNEKFKLWVGFDADNPARLATAVVTEVIPYPRHRILRIHTWATDTGYDFDVWYQPIVNQLEYYAKSIDCVALEAWCRKGLAKKLKWYNEYSVVVKPINYNPGG